MVKFDCVLVLKPLKSKLTTKQIGADFNISNERNTFFFLVMHLPNDVNCTRI